MLNLLLLLASTVSQDPAQAVTVQLNRDQFTTGERARVNIETARDGYLVVLHADPDGRVRVLFPLDPTDDNFVRGGRRQELRGRGDRDAFQVAADDGSGTVLAAVASDPLSFEGFVRNDHWDFRALGGPSATVQDDPLAGLLDVVQRMAGTTHFDYDAVTYVVNSRIASRYGYGYDPYHLGVRVGFGYPYRYGYHYDPFCYDPFWGTSCYGYGYGFGVGYGYPYRFYRPRPFIITTLGGRGTGTGGRFVVPRNRDRFTPVEVRPRAGAGFRDAGTIRSRSIERSVTPRSTGGRRDAPSVKPRSSGGRRDAPSVKPRSSGGRRDAPSVKPRSSGGRRDAPSASRGQPRSSGGGSRPSVSRGSGGGSRPAARPSGGNRGSSGGGGRRN